LAFLDVGVANACRLCGQASDCALRAAVAMLQARLGMSQRACRAVRQPRSTQRYPPPRPDPDRELRRWLREFSRQRPRWGYRRAHVQARAAGYVVNRKKIQRLWREEGLRVPTHRRKRQRLGTSTVPADRRCAERPNQV
jgi:putative transposase